MSPDIILAINTPSTKNMLLFPIAISRYFKNINRRLHSWVGRVNFVLFFLKKMQYLEIKVSTIID